MGDFLETHWLDLHVSKTCLNARKQANLVGVPDRKHRTGNGTFKIFVAEDETRYLDKYSIKESIAGETALLLYPRHPSHMHDTVRGGTGR
jgi:hypothetical protein